ncbi:MAG: TldD/PmbA family protein [Lachnospiraceae bacterium]|nr:TldD/PmbA family protein [Lachnospiraceae bacterium]
MKSQFSTTLTKLKPSLKILLKTLLDEYEYVSILAQEAEGKTYRVSKSGISIADNTLTAGKGAVIKVYDKKGYAEYSFNRLNDKFLLEIPKIIREKLIPMAGFIPDSISESNYPKLEDEQIVFSKASEYTVDPETLGDDIIINKLSDIHNKGLSYNEKILDCPAIFQYMKTDKLFLSENKDMEQSLLWSTGIIQPIASSNGETHYYHKPVSASGGAEILDNLMQYVDSSCDCVLALLQSTAITPGEYDVICMPDVTGMIAHEAFGHGVEMDMFVKKRALAEQYIGKYVASPLITMHDKASDSIEAGSYFFDDEGIISQDTLIIEKGILKRGISDMQTAMHLNTTPTGNGRRESYEQKAYTRMTNTYFEKGSDKLEDMIASISYGFLLENASCGMEDPKNWGIQCMVNMAREIKDGKLTGKVCSPVVLSGYVPDLLKSISMISDDFHLSGSGYCGKGYKEWVKVSDGGAAIKARVKLG